MMISQLNIWIIEKYIFKCTLLFRKVQNRTNSKFSVNSECSETHVSASKTGFLNPKTGFFDPKTGFFKPKNRKIFLNLFPNYFRKIFASSKRPDISKKTSKLRYPNYSETREKKVREIPSFAGPYQGVPYRNFH